jgi:hypothetical protein
MHVCMCACVCVCVRVFVLWRVLRNKRKSRSINFYRQNDLKESMRVMNFPELFAFVIVTKSVNWITPSMCYLLTLSLAKIYTFCNEWTKECAKLVECWTYKAFLKPTICTFIYQRLRCVSAFVSDHSQGALFVIIVSYLCLNGVLLVAPYCKTYQLSVLKMLEQLKPF